MLEKQPERRVADAVGRRVIDVRWAKEYPTLLDHLTQVEWSDGSKRQTSSLLVFADGGVCKAMLRDREAALCLWVACETVSGVFGVLEAALCDPRAEWRVDRQQDGQQASRRRRGS